MTQWWCHYFAFCLNGVSIIYTDKVSLCKQPCWVFQGRLKVLHNEIIMTSDTMWDDVAQFVQNLNLVICAVIFIGVKLNLFKSHETLPTRIDSHKRWKKIDVHFYVIHMPLLKNENLFWYLISVRTTKEQKHKIQKGAPHTGQFERLIWNLSFHRVHICSRYHRQIFHWPVLVMIVNFVHWLKKTLMT